MNVRISLIENKIVLKEDVKVLYDAIAKFPDYHTFVDEFALDLSDKTSAQVNMFDDEVIEYICAKKAENPNYCYNDYLNELNLVYDDRGHGVPEIIDEMKQLTKVKVGKEYICNIILKRIKALIFILYLQPDGDLHQKKEDAISREKFQ